MKEREPRRGELHLCLTTDCARGRYELHILPDDVKQGDDIEFSSATRIMNASGSLAEDWMAKSVAENYLRMGINIGIICHPDDGDYFQVDE